MSIQIGCVTGNKMLDDLVDLKNEYEKPCCYNDECCEGMDCDCCNEDGNKQFGHCECMITDDDYTEYLENQKKVNELDKRYRIHQSSCAECSNEITKPLTKEREGKDD